MVFERNLCLWATWNRQPHSPPRQVTFRQPLGQERVGRLKRGWRPPPAPITWKPRSWPSYGRNQSCGSRMFIPDPWSWFLPIPDPGSEYSKKREGWKKLVVIPFFVAINFTKLKIILSLECWRKKFGPIFKELRNFLSEKLSLSSQKYGFGIWDPRSRKNLFRIPDPGAKKRHRIPDPDPQHWSQWLRRKGYWRPFFKIISCISR